MTTRGCLPRDASQSYRPGSDVCGAVTENGVFVNQCVCFTDRWLAGLYLPSTFHVYSSACRVKVGLRLLLPGQTGQGCWFPRWLLERRTQASGYLYIIITTRQQLTAHNKCIISFIKYIWILRHIYTVARFVIITSSV